MVDKYSVSVVQLCIRYCLQLGMFPLPKTANPDHMCNNVDLNFEISNEDIKLLKKAKPISNYGEASQFPVFGEKYKCFIVNIYRYEIEHNL